MRALKKERHENGKTWQGKSSIFTDLKFRRHNKYIA